MLINESLLIAKKPESIWSYLMDVNNDVQWRNGIIKAQWISEPPYGLGSTGKHTHKDMGALIWEVTRFEDGNSFEFIHTEGGLKGSRAFFQVEPENNGSRLNVQMSISGPLIMRLMMLFMGSMMRKGVRGDIQKLKEILEAQQKN